MNRDIFREAEIGNTEIYVQLENQSTMGILFSQRVKHTSILNFSSQPFLLFAFLIQLLEIMFIVTNQLQPVMLLCHSL